MLRVMPVSRRSLACVSHAFSSSGGMDVGNAGSLIDTYKTLCHTGALQPDARQEAALQQMQLLRNSIRSHWSGMREYSVALSKWHAAVESAQAREREAKALEEAQLAAAPPWTRLWAKFHPFWRSAWQASATASQSYASPNCSSAAGGCKSETGQADAGGCKGKGGQRQLDEKERQHPFWTSGMGAAALRHEAANGAAVFHSDEPADDTRCGSVHVSRRACAATYGGTREHAAHMPTNMYCHVWSNARTHLACCI